MKLMTIAIFAAFCGAGIFSGDDGAHYLNDRMEPVHKKKAVYYCEPAEKKENGYHIKAYFLSGEIKMEGVYKDPEMKTAHGPFTFYYRSGQTESTGQYKDGHKYGIWQRYHPNGSAKSEKIYAVQPMLRAIEVSVD